MRSPDAAETFTMRTRAGDIVEVRPFRFAGPHHPREHGADRHAARRRRRARGGRITYLQCRQARRQRVHWQPHGDVTVSTGTVTWKPTSGSMRTFSLGASPLKQPRPTNANTQNVETPSIETVAVGFGHPAVAALNALLGAELASV